MDLLGQGLTWGQWFLAFLLTGISLLLILVVLIQRGRGTGLAGAFGGAGSSAFGAKTGDVLTIITCSFAAVFFLLAVVANHAFDYSADRAGDSATAETTPGAPGSTEPVPIEVVPGPDGVIEIPEGAIGPGGSSTIRVKIPPEGGAVQPTPAEGQPQAQPVAPAPAAQPQGDAGAPPADGTKPAEGGAEEGSKDKPSP